MSTKLAKQSLTLWFNGLIAILVIVYDFLSGLVSLPEVSEIIKDHPGFLKWFLVAMAIINYIIRRYRTKEEIQ